MLTILAVCLLSHHASPQHAASDWKLESVYLKTGQVFRGLIVKQDEAIVELRLVLREPGVRILTRQIQFDSSEIEKVVKLENEDRSRLQTQLTRIDEYTDREKRLATVIVLKPETWPVSEKKAWSHAGRDFVMITDLKEELARNSAAALSEIFEAYTQTLGVSSTVKHRIRILIYHSADEYHAMLKRRRLDLSNTAHYDPQSKEIHIVCDVMRRETELAQVRMKLKEQGDELSDYETKLRTHFSGKPPPSSIMQLRKLRRQLQIVDQENEIRLEQVKADYLSTMYHESFHAYADVYLLPDGARRLPGWLNEGLAQIFETAVLETGEFRIGHLDSRRLGAVQAAIRAKTIIPLKKLMSSSTTDFRRTHRLDRWKADQHYLTAWAFVYYLTFERKLLGGRLLNKLADFPAEGIDSTVMSERLLGEPLQDIERAFHAYMLSLRPDQHMGKLHR